MKIIIILICFAFPILLFSQTPGKADQDNQQNRMILCFGPSVNYFQGEYPGNFEQYEKQYLNVQINGFLGYLSQHSNRKNALGIFGTAGYTNKSTFLKLIDIQEIKVNQLDTSNYFTFYQVEIGMLAGKFLRFSTGYGKQNFKTSLGNDSFEYFSSTLGLNIDFGNLIWNIDANLNYGLDYQKTTLKLSTGFMVMF